MKITSSEPQTFSCGPPFHSVRRCSSASLPPPGFPGGMGSEVNVSFWSTASQISSTCPPTCRMLCSGHPPKDLVLEYFLSSHQFCPVCPIKFLSPSSCTSCLPHTFPVSLLHSLSPSCISCAPPILPGEDYLPDTAPHNSKLYLPSEWDCCPYTLSSKYPLSWP